MPGPGTKPPAKAGRIMFRSKREDFHENFVNLLESRAKRREAAPNLLTWRFPTNINGIRDYET